MFDVDRHLGRFDRNLFRRGGVEHIDGHRTGVFVVNEFGVVFLVTQFDQSAVVRSFGGMSVTSVIVMVVIRINGGGRGVCFNSSAGFLAADKAEGCRG